MSEWIIPIFDRTQEDVNDALLKIAEWKKNGSTDVYDLKGCFNVSDINRIEGNIKYLSDNLSKLCYFPNTISKTWDVSGLPDIENISRIIQNVAKIISAYYQNSTAPSLPETLLTYEEVNDLEQNLYLIKEILDDMITSFRECGTFSCGED